MPTARVRWPQNPFWGLPHGGFPSSFSPNAEWIPPGEAALLRGQRFAGQARNGFRAERSPPHSLNTCELQGHCQAVPTALGDDSVQNIAGTKPAARFDGAREKIGRASLLLLKETLSEPRP